MDATVLYRLDRVGELDNFARCGFSISIRARLDAFIHAARLGVP